MRRTLRDRDWLIVIFHRVQEILLRAFLEALVVGVLDRFLLTKMSLPPVPYILIDETDPTGSLS
jgi:hypothetical protein